MTDDTTTVDTMTDLVTRTGVDTTIDETTVGTTETGERCSRC
jgi:hypothetical protein